MTAHLGATGGRDVQTVYFPAGTPPEQVDVLVVGAGPVGLSAAIELAGRGVDVAVVDRARTATLVRAGAMGHASRVVEHFRRWGVLQLIRRDGIPDDADLSAEAQRRRAEIGALIGRGRFDSAGVELDERYDASAMIWYEPDQLDVEAPWRPDHYEDDPRPGHRAPDGYVDPWGDTLYGADNVLIRPDQHVAWRGARVPDGGAAAVLDRILGVSADSAGTLVTSASAAVS
jgi:NADPH-dependent 2,4-dienoyl-CoA reductase/sulfur reductase-like enzyme